VWNLWRDVDLPQRAVARYPAMTKRDKHQQALYLEPDRAALLDKLATETRIAKAVLLREAVDDLLVKYGKLKLKKSK
jgi:hypothetical protein